MKTLSKVFAMSLLMLAVTYGYGQKLSDASPMKQKIQSLNNKLAQAMIEKDENLILSYYTEDAVSLPNYNPMLNGIDAIKKYQHEGEAMGNEIKSMNFVTQSVEEQGDALIEVGSYDITMFVKNMDREIRDQGKYLTIWKKQADGTYKMAYEVWNSDENPMQRMKGQQPDGKQKGVREQKQERLNQGGGGQLKSSEKNPVSEVKKK